MKKRRTDKVLVIRAIRAIRGSNAVGLRPKAGRWDRGPLVIDEGKDYPRLWWEGEGIDN